MIGPTLAHYRITAAIGAGGMGEVYRATDTKLGRDVALKVLPPEMASDPERLERFQREAKALAALDHPGIVGVYSVEEAGGVHFLTMQLVEGQSLDRLISGDGLPVDRILAIAMALADALAAAHDKGIVHRDLKPANVMVTNDGRVKVLDFGLAKLTGAAGGAEVDSERSTEMRTREGVVMGTMPYMSPEQVQGQPVDQRTDIFSLGVILYEMASGRRPFQGRSSAALVSSILRDAPRPLGDVRPDLPAKFTEVIARCLEKDPRARPQTAEHLSHELEELRGVPSGRPTPVGTPRGRRRPAVVLVGVVAALMAVVAGVWRARSPSATEASLAVLPFANGGSDPDTEYLSDGVTVGLINQLSELPALKVMSRLSVERFSKGASDPLAAGRLLGVASILTGSLVVRGERLVIDAALLAVSDGHQLWGDRFERGKGDLLTIEREIVGKIGERLRVKLANNPDHSAAAVDPEAYDLYLRGRYVMLGTSDDGPTRAQEFFRRAIEREPRLAIAYAGLGDSYVDQSWLNSKDRGQTVPQAKAALKKAIELDPRLSEAHVLAAQIAQDFDWDWPAAEAAYGKAIELNPGSDLAHREYASYLLIMDRPDAAIAEARTAQSLDPLSVYATHQLAFNLMAAGRLPEAATQFRAAIELNPTWVWGSIKLSLTYALMGDRTKALAAAARADELLGKKAGSPLAQSWLAWTAYLCGDPTRLEQTLARLHDQARTTFVDPAVLAELYYPKRDLDRMFESLERGYDARSPLLVHLGIQGRFLWKDIARDPRYLSLVKRMAYPPARASR